MVCKRVLSFGLDCQCDTHIFTVHCIYYLYLMQLSVWRYISVENIVLVYFDVKFIVGRLSHLINVLNCRTVLMAQELRLLTKPHANRCWMALAQRSGRGWGRASGRVRCDNAITDMDAASKTWDARWSGQEGEDAVSAISDFLQLATQEAVIATLLLSYALLQHLHAVLCEIV